MKIDNTDFVLWDLSGDPDYLGIWKNYIKKCDFIIFLIDGSDHSEQNFQRLEKIFSKYGDDFKTKTLLIFTKNDKKTFKINKFLNFLKNQKFFVNLIGISEVNAKENTIIDKIFKLLN